MTGASVGALVAVLILFFVLLAIRLHVAFALMLAGLLGVVMLRSTDAAVSTGANAPFSTAADYSLIIIPLFIFMGVLAVKAGLAQAGFDVASRVLRKLPGGAALSSLAGSGMFAAVTGSSVATVATLAKVSTEEILKAGHSIKLAAGVVCAGGTLGVLIPPSIILVLYGIITEESIGRLLLAGIAPGILTILFYGMTIMGLVTRERRRTAGTANSLIERERAAAEEAKKIKMDGMGFAYLIVIFAVSIGTIYLGVATPTEAASFGATAALIILFIRSQKSKFLTGLKDSLVESIGLTSMTFLLMVGAGVFTYFLALSGASTALVDAVVSADVSPYLVLVLCLLMIIPLGMFLDGTSMILIAAPLLHPILTGYGFDAIWIGILIVKVAEMALITPPVGMNAFVYVGTVPQARLGETFRGIFPFIIADIVVVAILILVPDIVTFIPDLSGTT